LHGPIFLSTFFLKSNLGREEKTAARFLKQKLENTVKDKAPCCFCI